MYRLKLTVQDYSGTIEFVGSALVFHKTTGQPFTVTYSIDAVAKPTINQD